MAVFTKVRSARDSGGIVRRGRWEDLEPWDPGYTLFVNQDGGFEVLFEGETDDGEVELYESIFDGDYEADRRDHVTGISWQEDDPDNQNYN